MLKVGILFITLSTVVFAANASDIIWTWGNGNSIASIFSFLYFLLNIDSLAVLIKYAAVIGMIVVFMREYAKGDGMKPSLLGLKMFLFFAMTQATVTFFLTVKQTAEHRIYILSANELSSASWAKCRPVNGDNECYAPIGIKFIFSALTNFEKAGLSSMESAMMDANALTYSFSRMGYGFGLHYIDAMSKTSVGTHQYNTFMEFYENCIIYDLSDGSKDVDAYYKSKDLASYLLSSNSRLTTVYNTAHPNGVVKACYEVSEADLMGTITCVQKAQSVMAGSSGAPSSESSITDICTAGEQFTQRLFDSTKSSDDSIKQHIAIKLSNEAMVNSAIASGLNPSELAYGTTLAQRELQSKWTTMGILAKEWIPSMRGIMQGIAIGLIWVLALMSIATASPAPYLGSVIGFQLTLVVWSFMLSLINYMTIDRITDAVPHLFITDLGAGEQLTLMSDGAIGEEIQKAMAFLGYMAVGSYAICAGLIKLGGNMLSSLGSGAGQITVGMGVASDLARGHQDYGLTKADASGIQTVNKRGDVEKINASGYEQTETNRQGYSEKSTAYESTQGGGFNTMTEHTGVRGEKSVDVKNQSGDQSITAGSSGVTKANLSGIKADTSQSFNHSAEEMKNKSASLETSASQTIASSLASTNSSAQEFIRGATQEKGSSAGVDTAKTYNDNVQNNLQEAYKNGRINEETYNALRSVNYSAGAEVSATAKGGFELFGTGVSTGGTARVGADMSSSGQHNTGNKISLSKEEAEVLSRSMATGLFVSAKSTQGMSDRLTEGIIQKTGTSLAQTSEASLQFSESKKLAQTAQKLEKFAEANGVSHHKDLMIDVANAAIYGNESLGIRGLGIEKGADMLFNNKPYLEEITHKLIQDTVAKTLKTVDTDVALNHTQEQMQSASQEVVPLHASHPNTVDIASVHSKYANHTKDQGDTVLQNMPDTTNAPTLPHDGFIQENVNKHQPNHEEQNVFALATPIDVDPKKMPDIKTGKEYLNPKARKEH